MSSSLVLLELIEDKEEIENNINMIILNIINIDNDNDNDNDYYMKIEINKRKLFMINEKINNYKK